MYSMKEACEKTGMSYETLKFYCNEGLVPHVKRDEHGYRVFDQRDVNWLCSLICLKKCGMGIADMRQYLQLCLQGKSTIPQRKEILARKREELVEKLRLTQECIQFIDAKQQFYDDVQAGHRPYTSNLLPPQDQEEPDSNHKGGLL